MLIPSGDHQVIWMMVCMMVLSVEMVLEFAWKLLCALISSTSSMVRLTLDASSALDSIEPRVPVFGVSMPGMPEA